MRGKIARKAVVFAYIALIAGFMVTPARPSSVGTIRSDELNRVASDFAKRPVTVICDNQNNDPVLKEAWGYVNAPASTAKFTVLNERLCVGALAIREDLPYYKDFWKALGAAVLVHEANHLRIRPGNDNEAITECRAFQNFDHILEDLGASEAEMARLIPLMIINHYKLGAYTEWASHDPMSGVPTYYMHKCTTPRRYWKWIGR